jgi:NAD(P) transhydrogenase subunit alpha
MKIGVPKETFPGERRVALIPDSLPPLTKGGHEIRVQSGAGQEAGFIDDAYKAKGGTLVADRAELFQNVDIVLQVRGYGSNLQAGKADLALMKPDQILVGMYDPLGEPGAVKELAEKNIKAFAMELMPRITRAQSMDVLSSMATVAGYKAVLIAAEYSPRFFPMFMTAAGTIAPARVFVIGAGVAGLQAISTAKRLGAIVHAYDIRPAVKEQIESLGAKFVEMEIEAGDAEDKGGYAKEMGEEFYRRQRELMTRVVGESHVVITTAAIPGKKSPVLVTAEMVKGMTLGSVIVDLAAERGGNCEVTKADEIVVEHGVTILGPTNLPTTIPFHASQMYAKNLTNFLKEITDEKGNFVLDMENEVHRDTLLTDSGRVVQPHVCELLGIAPPAPPAKEEIEKQADAQKKE